MKKIFLLGMSPLPFENDKKVYGTGIRTWQFVLPLLEKGFRICVCNYAIPSAYQDNFESVFKKDLGKNCRYSFEYHILKKDDFENIGLLSNIFTKFKPDCIVGCTFYPSYIAFRMLHGLKDRNVPFWADLFGHVMAEAQARANIDKSDDCLFHYWNSEYNIVSTADIFSCVSSRQQYALIGELGAAGRLNKYTSGYDFTSVIPCGIPRERYRHTRDVIRGKDGIKKDDFVVLWAGGYNTWTDVDTLFKGLTLAMSKDPKVKFVSTGGEIPEQDIKTYPRFLSMINSSPYRDRFFMKGWIKGKDVPNYYLEADVGINIDKDIYEVRLGSKNRILDWLRAGLCVLSSNVCELTDLMEKEKIGYTFKPYDHNELGSKIIYLAGHPDEVKKTADAGLKYGLENFNFESTTLKLQEWADSPSYSPDKGKKRKLFFKREEAVKNLVKITLEQKKMIEERDRRISELEGIVKKGLVYKIYSYLRIIKRKMSR
jgi:glycosyltransferase involved in cell wall biosynthesis